MCCEHARQFSVRTVRQKGQSVAIGMIRSGATMTTVLG